VHFLLEIKISKCFAKNTLYGRGVCILYEFWMYQSNRN
jgi:hypothetical protein